MRRFMRGELDMDRVVGPDPYVEAVAVIEAWRAAHATPLVTANNGLRSMLRT